MSNRVPGEDAVIRGDRVLRGWKQVAPILANDVRRKKKSKDSEVQREQSGTTFSGQSVFVVVVAFVPKSSLLVQASKCRPKQNSGVGSGGGLWKLE